MLMSRSHVSVIYKVFCAQGYVQLPPILLHLCSKEDTVHTPVAFQVCPGFVKPAIIEIHLVVFF